MTDPAQPTQGHAKPPYCLLVSSCDAYADCWLPFFTLLATYWRPCDCEIYLNTETRSFSHPALDIHCPRVGLAASHELTWSERLLRCLDTIPYETVLYLQEDYFIKDTVDVTLIESFAQLMRQEHISHISLERGTAITPGDKTPYRFLSLMHKSAAYRISTQAGLWKVSALRSNLRRHETVWEFEEYGTKRARRNHEIFLFLNEEYQKLHDQKPIAYDPTGVVQGQWARNVVEELFAAHNIDVDYAARGFYNPHTGPNGHRTLRTRARKKLRSIRSLR